MFRNKKKVLGVFFLTIISVAIISSSVMCQEKIEEYIPDVEVAEEGMTLWQIIKAGGEIMIVLAFLSIAALALVIYYFLSFDPKKLLPEDFLARVTSLIKENRSEEVKTACKNNPNLVSDVVLAGFARVSREKTVVEEAMLDKGKRSVGNLTQKLSYLADVAVISPMVGLLGTVLGMIQAFNVIAFQTGAVKPILLAGGISKAMVTTAFGLIIAIPSMIFYAYFRGKVQNIASHLENVSTDLMYLITEKV
ncbi:MAG: MotA/TolQ/ExbB proton channel family protein [Candidatus Omnitrophota bacterium]|jgi:biopolymer transport protein ExbB